MMYNKFTILVSVVFVLGCFLAGANTASAHESRTLAGGKYQVRVGFASEPPYEGLENGLDLTVCNGECVSAKDNSGTLANGLAGLFDTLKVEVIFGAKTQALTLVAVPRNAGRYTARFVPTKAGDYTFHLSGKINNDSIDEKFSSGPDTFDAVQPLTAIQFPDKPGYNLSQPTLITPNSTASPTVTVVAIASNDELANLRNQLNEQNQQLQRAKTSADSANTLAGFGIGAGLLGMALAFGLWLLGRKRPLEGG